MEVSPEIIFGILVTIIVVPVVYVVFTGNIIRAAFAFAVSLLGLAALYACMNAGFMAVVQILIYAGGVVVLLIFGVMLSRSSSTRGVYTDHQFVVLGSIASVALLYCLVTVLKGFPVTVTEAVQSGLDTTYSVGVLMLTDHLVAFELIAYVLLVVLVGAAFISKKMTE